MLPFLEPSTIYYSPTTWKAIKGGVSELKINSLEISTIQKLKTDICLTMEPTAVWGSTDGLIIQCALRFGNLRRMSRQILGNNVGLLIFSHVSTSNHGSVKRHNSHIEKNCSVSSTQLKQDLNEAYQCLRSKSAEGADQEVRGCLFCPTDFQISVNSEREVVVMVWRILGKNEDGSILMGMCEPDERMSYSARLVKSGEVKYEYERLYGARACRL